MKIDRVSMIKKCEECRRAWNNNHDNWCSVQMYGGEWKIVCVICARKLKAANMLGKAMDDIEF